MDSFYDSLLYKHVEYLYITYCFHFQTLFLLHFALWNLEVFLCQDIDSQNNLKT